MKRTLASILASGFILANAGCSTPKKGDMLQKEGKVIINNYPGTGKCTDLENGRKVFRFKISNTDEVKRGLSVGMYGTTTAYDEFIFKDLNCEDILYILNENSNFDSLIQRDILTKAESDSKRLHYLEDRNSDGVFNGEDFYINYKTKKDVTNPEKGQKLLNRLRNYFLEK